MTAANKAGRAKQVLTGAVGRFGGEFMIIRPKDKQARARGGRGSQAGQRADTAYAQAIMLIIDKIMLFEWELR